MFALFRVYGWCPEKQDCLFPTHRENGTVCVCVCVRCDGGEGCCSGLMNPSAFKGHSSPRRRQEQTNTDLGVGDGRLSPGPLEQTHVGDQGEHP